MSTETHPLDKFLNSVNARIAAFVWGIAEAAAFFIVPDVLLTAIGCRSMRAGLKATALATLGALIGGMIMYTLGRQLPEQSQTFLTHIPAIHSRLIEQVQAQLSAHGLLALLIGPTKGIPYKIYATEWGIRHGSLLAFLLVTIPARGTRFIFSVLLANGIGRLIQPWTKRNVVNEMMVLATFWIGFYGIYFWLLGW